MTLPRLGDQSVIFTSFQIGVLAAISSRCILEQVGKLITPTVQYNRVVCITSVQDGVIEVNLSYGFAELGGCMSHRRGLMGKLD